MADVVERLEGDAADQRRVADDNCNALHRVTQIPGRSQTLGNREAGAGVAAVEDVVLRLNSAWKATDSAQLAECPELGVAAREQLVGIGLMTGVPNDPVARRFQDSVQGQRQLHNSKRGTQMASGLGDGGNDALANLGGKRFELLFRQSAQVARSLQRGQKCQLHILLGGSPVRALLFEWSFIRAVTCPFRVCRAVYRS